LKLRAFVLYFLFISFGLGANITDIIFPDKQNNEGIFELTLYVSGDFNASFEQKDEGSVTILIFKGLKSDKLFTKTLDTETIKSVTVKPDANTTKISFEGKRLFDVSVSSELNKLHIAVIPKAAPLMIEDIAKDTASGGQIGYILETLLVVALVLFAFTVIAILFLKFKLSSHIKKKSIQEPQEKEKPQEITQSEEPIVSQKRSQIPKKPKKSPTKKQKTLFDM
jgi:hypothetical protein